ncbi:MAG: protein translocase subunit SecF [Candidatus Margulisiibacteriota bacterium]
MLEVIGRSKVWFVISGILIALAIFAFVFNAFIHGKPMNFGIDFTGGTLLNLRFERPPTVAEVRSVLNSYGLGESIIQKSKDNEVLIRTLPLDNEIRTKLIQDLAEKVAPVEILEADVIGPTIGRELTTQTLWALVIASLGIIIYVSFRFEFKYAVCALLALYHDAIITAGIIALLWRNVEVPFVAAILTIMGYSINDTIVVFDRIRENLKKPNLAKKKLAEIVNLSIWETLARSINTVLTTIIMVLCLLFFGGATLRDFALTLLIGFTVGAYSSIFVASPLLVAWQKKR